jgi:hypothetical protein
VVSAAGESEGGLGGDAAIGTGERSHKDLSNTGTVSDGGQPRTQPPLTFMTAPLTQSPLGRAR